MAFANGQFSHLLVALKDVDCGRSVSRVPIQIFGPKPAAFLKVSWEIMAGFPLTYLLRFMVPTRWVLLSNLSSNFTIRHHYSLFKPCLNHKATKWSTPPPLALQNKSKTLATLLEGLKCTVKCFTRLAMKSDIDTRSLCALIFALTQFETSWWCVLLWSNFPFKM